MKLVLVLFVGKDGYAVKYFLLVCFILMTPTFSQAAFWTSSDDPTGMGYVTKEDGIKAYERFDGDTVVATLNEGFPLVAFEKRSEWLGIMAIESIENGRAHVRYFNNGRDAKGGESIAWINVNDLERFQFDCCNDDAHCSGITRPMFKTDIYTECFNQAFIDNIQKKTPQVSNVAVEQEKSRLQSELDKSKFQYELEKTKLQSEEEILKLQLEVEKLKLEIQKLKLKHEQMKSGAK